MLIGGPDARMVGELGGQLLARPDDDACAFDAEILTVEAANTLRRTGTTRTSQAAGRDRRRNLQRSALVFPS